MLAADSDHGVSLTTLPIVSCLSMSFMSPSQRTSLRLTAFIGAVVIGTAAVIVLIHWITGSWAVGATAGVIAGVLSTAMYPVFFRKH
jgi:nucleoside permease NupC